MSCIGRISFLSLDGTTPDHLDLDKLPPPTDVAEVIREAFLPYLVDGTFKLITGFHQFETASSNELHLIYLYGHAWLGPSGPEVAIQADGDNKILQADDLLRVLLSEDENGNVVLVFDCCHAEAFDQLIAELPKPPILCLYGAGKNEKAIALNFDRASRLSLALGRVLSDTGRSVDLVWAFAEVADQLNIPGALGRQKVSYRMSGSSIRLHRTHQTARRWRYIAQRWQERTAAVARNIFVLAGSVLTLFFVVASWFYWSHALIEIDLLDLNSIADEINIVASEEDPDNNASQIFEDRTGVTGRTRIWVPAANIILRIKADYIDSEERSIAFHLELQPGFDPMPKFQALQAPSAAETKMRPGMAYVPPTKWFHGREIKLRNNTSPYWIDIRPITVSEYLPIARELLSAGVLEIENSFILTAMQTTSALDNLGFGQLRGLSNDLGEVFTIIEAANTPRVSAPTDIVAGLVDIPCLGCPAPLTRYEAELLCSSQGKRIPSDVEWELAVRGVDGRVFPWGNRFDSERANVPGLPDKGDPASELKPVDAYSNYSSPFGLIDTVGNAGDWVTNVSGSYEHVYMGATYRYNPEDATAFRMLPVTDSDYLVREITVRCGANSE